MIRGVAETLAAVATIMDGKWGVAGLLGFVALAVLLLDERYRRAVA